ncbi:hypothetical protein D3870_16510 [Noviherbaspirillum cavernae]|uniref:Uncharacterized protein n=2 Tax=Noviherbaspirillum cavernae TaxID=2320862 RepID=A0A418X4J6_9BURK|nr:hypothetical protein D3870_16510 [Noviherbaspirillum cavernae]
MPPVVATMLENWTSFFIKPRYAQPPQDGWYETSTDAFATTLVLYWRGVEWVASPDSPQGKEHIRQDRQWRVLPEGPATESPS